MLFILQRYHLIVANFRASVNNLSLFSNRNVLLSIVLLVFCFAKEGNSQWHEGLYAEAHGGMIVPHRPELKGIVSGHSKGFAIGKEWDVDGSERWHYHYHAPKFGFEFYAADLGNRQQLGRQLALSAFTRIPLGKVKFRDHLFIAVGAGYSDTKWNLIDNQKAIALGSNFNVAISVAYLVSKEIGKTNFYGGLRMTHLSNSAVVMPNLGTNNMLVVLGINLDQDRKKMEPGVFTSNLPQRREWRVQYAVGMKQITPALSPFYPIHTLSASYTKRTTWNLAYFVRSDLFYNPSLRPIIERNEGRRLTNSELLQHGIGIGYAQIFGNTRAELMMGVYTVNSNSAVGMFYHRLGLRHQLKKVPHLELTVNLMTHWAKAHHPEVGMSWRF